MSTIQLSIVDRYPGVEIGGFDRSGVIARESPAKIPIGRSNKDGVSFPNAKVPGASAGCAIVSNDEGGWELHIWHEDKPMVNGVRVAEDDEIRLNDGDIIGIVQNGFTKKPANRSARLREFWRKLTGKGPRVGVAARIRVGIKPEPEEKMTSDFVAEIPTEPEIAADAQE